MEKRKNDFGSNDRGGRFDKKPGRPENRGSSKGRSGSYSKSRDDFGEFSDNTRGSRGPSDRTGEAPGRRGTTAPGGAPAYGRKDGASGYGRKDGASGYDRKDGASAYGRKDGASSYGRKDTGSGYDRKEGAPAYGRKDGASSYARKDSTSAYGRKEGAPAYGRKDGASGYGRKEGASAYGRKDGVSGYGKKEGASAYGRKDTASAYSKKDAPAYNRKYTESDNRGTAANYRTASPEDREISSERNEISPGRKGFSPNRRDTSSMYNTNAKKSASEDKFSRSDRQDADQAGMQEDLDKLEGRNSVIEALKSGRSINKIFVSKGEREGSVNQIIAMARQNHILIQEVDRGKLDEMSVTHAHQGVIALAAAKDYVEVEKILQIAEESGRPPFIIILDELTDPYNLGSILRTANAAGVHGIIIPKRRAIGLTAAVSKASAGAIEYVPVARVTNIVQTIESLKKENIWVVGTDSTGEKAYFESDLAGPVALVIGSEGEGMGKLVRESCDFVVNIPMLGKISSLNAAVAGAIVTYEILRQRNIKKF